MYQTTVTVDGMMCGNCEKHVNEAIKEHFSIKKVTSSHDTGETVILSEAPLDEALLESAIADAGYTATGIQTTEAPKKKGLFSR